MPGKFYQEGKAEKVNIKDILDRLTLEQTVPIIMNREQILTTVADDKDFIASNSVNGIPTGVVCESLSKLKKAFILIIGRAVNSYDGENYLDCSTPTDNQWQVNINNSAYSDLENNDKADGQMLDTDWECIGEGIIHPFTFLFDITELLTSLTDRIGLRLTNGRAIQDSLIVTIDIYFKAVFTL